MTVRFPNYSDTTIQLKIDNVGNYIEPTNRTFRVKSTIKDNDFFLPNMLAEISITDLSVANGIVIPAQAILIDPESNDFVFRVIEEKDVKKSKKVIVEVIERYEGKALIKAGSLSPGDEIVVKGARGIGEGTAIQISK